MDRQSDRQIDSLQDSEIVRTQIRKTSLFFNPKDCQSVKTVRQTQKNPTDRPTKDKGYNAEQGINVNKVKLGKE